MADYLSDYLDFEAYRVMAKGKRVPKYALHAPTGQARVQVDGQSIYLGKFDSPESKVRYQQLVADLQRKAGSKADSASLTIGAMAVAYIGHCRGYYRKNGVETSEVACIQLALKPLIRMFSGTLATAFSPFGLQQVRDEMIRMGWVRNSINKHVGRIRKMFKWAVSCELITSPDVLGRLNSVDGLRSGRTSAVESEPVQPVSRSAVDAVEPHVLPAVWAMIRLQLATGMRPGEARIMRLADIERCGDEWAYSPTEHKTQHRGKQRRIYIGPIGREILSPYLKTDRERYLFESSPGECYSKDSYNRAVSRACKRAGIEAWSPNQLRHTAATEIRKRFGLEASRVILGHASAETTLIYAERDFEAAKLVIQQMG